MIEGDSVPSLERTFTIAIIYIADISLSLPQRDVWSFTRVVVH